MNSITRDESAQEQHKNGLILGENLIFEANKPGFNYADIQLNAAEFQCNHGLHLHRPIDLGQCAAIKGRQ